MSHDDVSTAAKLNAERLMSGRKITDDEMRVIMAGLLLSVDRLTNALVNVEGRMWSDDHLREIVSQEVKLNCKAMKGTCPDAGEKSAHWLGRFFRSVLGIGSAATLVLASSGCAVAATRSEGIVSDMVYPAARLDVGCRLWRSCAVVGYSDCDGGVSGRFGTFNCH